MRDVGIVVKLDAWHDRLHAEPFGDVLLHEQGRGRYHVGSVAHIRQTRLEVSFAGPIMAPIMGLETGTTLGPYEILSFIGAGGMGEVYRARDTRLGREVAIKVLPADRVGDDDRRRRFVQEAHAASALNHPHIVTIHEIESADGNDFIVMEYVRGKSLDALISAPAGCA